MDVPYRMGERFPRMLRRQDRPFATGLGAALALVLLMACSGSGRPSAPADAEQDDPAPTSTPAGNVDDQDIVPVATDSDETLAAAPLADGFSPLSSDQVIDRSVFDQDGYATVDVTRFDVRTVTTPGICVPGDESGCTLADVLADTDGRDDFKVDIDIHFRADDYPEDGQVANAELRQRGGGARLAQQKSFRIRFSDGDAIWRGERRLLLNKHPYESSRIRNKLAFDLMSQVPHLTSLRTQFVHLFIDDGAGPVNNGLYTHVEGPGGRFLERRGFDDADRLYKANDFRFSLEDLSVLGVDAQGQPLDGALFEDRLEIENGDDHRALLEMMRALHDPARSFESVLDEHFNRNNVLAWLATNVLLSQKDAVRHNYILHNPVGTERFYFVPWDYDLTFADEEEPANDFSTAALKQRLKYGYAANAKNRFVSRFYRLPGAHQGIVAAANELRENHLTDADVGERARRYADVVAPVLQQLPDSRFNGEYYRYSSDEFAGYVAGNADALRTRFRMPLPPSLQSPVRDADDWLIAWKPAFEVTGSGLTYDLTIATSVLFAPDSIVYQQSGIVDTGVAPLNVRIEAQLLRAGRHFVRLVARTVDEPERFWQIADNTLVEDGETHLGIVAFDID